jgi:hypothetical protein
MGKHPTYGERPLKSPVRPKASKVAWYKDELVKDRLLAGLGKGKENAKTRAKFLLDEGKISAAEAAAFSKVDSLQRQLRDADEYWRNKGVPVISCADGIFLAETAEEVDEYQEGLKANADARYRTAGLNLVIKEE